MTEASLYERLGGAFAIAAVVDHFSDAVVRNPITGQGSKDPKLRRMEHRRSGQASRPEVHAHSLGLRHCGRPPGLREPRNRAVLTSAWRRPIGRSKSLPQSSTNSWLSLGDRSTTSTCRRRRKGRYWLPSPPTKAR